MRRGTVIDRIAILGGSSVYIPEFIGSLTSHNINVGEVVLQGRPGDKLPIVADFCRRLVKRQYPNPFRNESLCFVDELVLVPVENLQNRQYADVLQQPGQ